MSVLPSAQIDTLQREGDLLKKEKYQLNNKRDRLWKEVQQLQKSLRVTFASISILFVLYILYKSGVLFHVALLSLSLLYVLSLYMLANMHKFIMNKKDKRKFRTIVVFYLILFKVILFYMVSFLFYLVLLSLFILALCCMCIEQGHSKLLN